MPAIAAGAWLGTAIAGAAGAGATIVAGKMSSNAYNKSAQLQTSAANHAADVGAQSNAEALAFQKAEAAKAHAETERATHANYDQWAAQQRRYGSLDSLVGNAPREIPAYVPLNSDNGAPAGSLASVAGTSSGNPTDRAAVLQQLSGVYKSLGLQPTGRGTGPTDIEYMADQVLKTGGWTPQNAQYWPGRIADEVAKAGGRPTAPNAPQGSLAALSGPYAPQTRILTPALQAYPAGSLGQMGRV